MDQEREEGIRRMEKEIQSIAKAEEVDVKVEWLDPPIEHREGKTFQAGWKMAKVTAGEKKTSIVFDWPQIRDFIPESKPDYLQKIRAKIQAKIRELKNET